MPDMVQISAELTQQEKEDLDALVAEWAIPQKVVIRQAIVAFLKANEKDVQAGRPRLARRKKLMKG